MAESKEVTTIIVRFEDEITTVLEKLESIASNQVVVSIPKGSDLLLSGVSMKVLVRKIIKLNKTAILVTDDEVGSKLADEAGLLVKPSTKSVSDSDWTKAKELLKEEKNKEKVKKKELKEKDFEGSKSVESFSPDNSDDVELKALAGENDVRMEEVSSSDGLDSAISSKSKKQSIEKQESPMDLGRSREVGVIEDSLKKDSESNANIKTVNSGDFKMTIDSSPVKKSSNSMGTIKASDSKELTPEQDNMSSTSSLTSTLTVDSGRKLIGRDFSKFKPVGTLDTSLDSLPGEEIKTSRKRSVFNDFGNKIKSGLKKFKPLNIFRSGLFKIGLALLVVLSVSVGAYAVFIMPEVVVNLEIESIPVDFKGDVTAETSVEELDEDVLKIRAKKGTVEKNSSDTTSATGTDSRGESASGVVTIYNNKEDAVVLASGTVFSNGGLNYILQSDVTIPQKPDAVGMGSASGSIVAEEVGSEYNIAGGTTFAIGNYALSDVKATNAAALTGGSKEEFTVVTQNDIDTLADTIKEDLFNQAEGELKDIYDSNDWIFVEESMSSQVKGDVSSDVLAGTEADSVNVSVEVEANALFYSRSDMDTLIESMLIGDLDRDNVDGLELSDEISREIQIAESSLEDGSISLSINISGFVMAELDKTSIVDKLISKNWAEGMKELKNVEFLSKDPETEYFPEWMPEIFWRWPSDRDRIIIKIQNIDPQSEEASTPDGDASNDNSSSE